MSHVIGIDVSTTATKAILVDHSGNVVATAVSEYGFDTPHPLWSEQNPLLWWDAAKDAISRLLASSGSSGEDIDAVGLTGQMHGLVLLDRQGAVLRPAILWNDQRTGQECDEIRATLGFERMIATTGNDALTGFTAPKILWVRNHEPAVFDRAAHVLLPKDYVRFQLTGEYATDKAGASGTQLFDLKTRDWSRDVLDALSIDPGLLPSTHEGPEVTGLVSTEAAAATGLRAGTPVVAGGGDQAANAVGTGAIDPGIVTISLGTSGVVFAATDNPTIESSGRVHAFCHAVPHRWHMMGVMLSAAGSLRWIRDALAPGTDFGALIEPATSVEAGSDGLLFLPYLSGERTPHPDPLARGAFVGLTLRHGLPHMVRAVLEGVAFGLRDGMDLMAGAGVSRIDQIRASGGGIRSALWRQILADVLDAEIATVTTAEGAAFGAAVLAATGAGWWSAPGDAVRNWVRVTSTTEPSPDRERYADLHGVYRDVYPALRTTFGALSSTAE